MTITGIVVKLPSGALSDVLGFRRLMMAGAMVKATGPFLYLLVGSWPILLLVRLYHGLATALYAPAASALVARAYPAERGRRLGIYGSAMGVFGSLWDIGHATGPIMFGFLLVVLGYRTSWLIMASLMACAVVVFLAAHAGTRTGDGT